MRQSGHIRGGSTLANGEVAMAVAGRSLSHWHELYSICHDSLNDLSWSIL